MSNKKRCKLLVTAWIWIISLSSLSTYAATLSLSPALQEVALGESTTVNLNISDLGNFAAPSLGAFLVEITFDASILSFDTVSYGSYLGAPSETTITTSVGAGIVSLYESSLLLNSELDVIQPDSFTLATLQFTANNLGTSGLSFGTVDLSDAFGSPIYPTLVGGSITVVPIPAPILLFFSGFISLIGIARRKKS